MQPNPIMSAPLGIVAGSGHLPDCLIQALEKQQRSFFVVGFPNETDSELIPDVPHAYMPLGAVGKIIRRLRSEGVQEVVLAGRVGRPALSSLRPDFTGLKLLSRLRKLRHFGDNAIFSTIIDFLENHGFRVLGVQDVLSDLLAPTGVMGTIQPDKAALQDIERAKNVVLAIGRLDIGQAVVVQQGVVLGVEATEGTDALIERCESLKSEGPGGVLIKLKKPNQESRIDLPTIGIQTIDNAHKAGLRAIALHAGGALIIDRDRVIERANTLGVSLIGVEV